MPYNTTDKNIKVYTKSENITLPSGENATLKISGLTKPEWPVTEAIVKVNNDDDITYRQNQT